MKIKQLTTLREDRVVHCPKGGFVSERMLLESDGMGYTMTMTTITPGRVNYWHYKNHLESCYCVSGEGEITSAATAKTYPIMPGTLYVLDEHDPHYVEAFETLKLICVFNPPLTGREVHDETGAYKRSE